MNDHEQHRSGRRSSSAGRQSALQIRASKLVRKLGFLTSKLGAGAQIKTDTAKQIDNYPYRKTRSMDMLRSKPYMSSPMLAVGFQSQPLARRSGDGSHESGSDGDSAHAKKPSLGSGSIAQDLAVAAMVAEASLRPSLEVSEGRPNGAVDSSSVANNRHNQPNQLQNTDHLESPPPPSKRPGHPRLPTLPPLNFNLKGVTQDERGSSRFSPSLIVRPPPFPILELPALPTPVAETSATGSLTQSQIRRCGPRLNSMPMLPMEGADERENDPDHENYGLDEDEEGDEDDNEDEGTGETVGSDDEDEETGSRGRTTAPASTVSSSPTASFLSRTRALSPRLPLPTASLTSLLGSVGGGGGTGSASASGSHAGTGPEVAESGSVTTPKGATRRNGNINGRDYFSSSLETDPASAEDKDLSVRPRGESFESSSYPHAPSSSSLRTPTARDYPASQTPMIYVAPPPPPPPWTHSAAGASGSDVRTLKASLSSKNAGADVPHLALVDSPKRPSIYHHASKSMIELFSSAATPSRGGDPNAITPGVADHDVKGKSKATTENSVQTLKASPGKGKVAKDKKDPGTLLAVSPDTNARTLQKELPSAPPAASDPAPSLRRQCSMPTFSVSGPPPPYPSFPIPEHLRRFVPSLPREDEGKEALPSYSNAIRLAAIMPRKMEFSAPGVPSRDRKWRRVHCVLEGTAFRVYDAPPRVSGVSALGGWWERKVGVGDVSVGLGTAASATPGATTNIIIGRKDPKKRMKWEEELQAEEAAQRAEAGGEDAQVPTTEVNVGGPPLGLKSKRHLAASFLHPNRSRNSLAQAQLQSPVSPRSSFQTPRTSAESSAPPSTRPSIDLSIPASSFSVSSSTVASAPTSTSASSTSLSGLSTNSGASLSSIQTRRRGHVRSDSARSTGSDSRSHSRSHSLLNPESQSQSQNSSANPSQSQSSLALPEPEERDLLRVYSLQRAESGLASDYTKRKNVVRVRMEGEQFLLQCTDVAGVVEWIEGLQAATNIALDLDERPMPKGPIFPRRRRRRRVQRTEPGSGQPAAGAGAGAGAGSGTNEPGVS